MRVVDIERRQIRRALVMNAIFDAADGSEERFADVYAIAEKLGLEQQEARDILKYLEGEHLIECLWVMGPTLPHVQLTHWGIREIEQQRSNPNQPTSHFPAFNVITVHGNLVNSPIQQGSPGADQRVEYNIDQRKLVLEFVEQARDRLTELGLSGDDQAVLEAHLATVDAQARSPKPDNGIIRVSLQAAKAVLMAAATSEASTLLLDLLKHIPH